MKKNKIKDDKLRIALIPAAGLATRWAPLSNIVPKELLPIGSYPIIYYTVMEALNNGIDKIYIVINKNKKCIIKFFKSLNNKKLFKKLKFIYQKKPDGLNDAILCGEKYIKEPFLLMLPDVLFSNYDTGKLISIYKEINLPIISVTEVPKKELKNYGVITKFSHGSISSAIDEFIFIEKCIEKPKDMSSITKSLAISGRYILTPRIFHYIKNTKDFTEALDKYDFMAGLVLPKNLDTGTPEKYLNTLEVLKHDRYY